MKKILLYGLVFLFTFSCVPEGPNPFDVGTTPINEEFSEEEIVNLRVFMRNAITGNSSKTWFFNAATFETEFGNEDASNLKNIRDDEFVFRKIDESEENQFRGIVEWRPGLSIPEDATSLEALANGAFTEPMTIQFEVGRPSDGKRTVPNQFKISFDESTLTDIAGKSIKSKKIQPNWPWKYWYGNVDTIEEYIARSTGPRFFPPRDCNDVAGWNLSRLWMTPEAKNQERLRLCSREKEPKDETAPVPDNPEGIYMVANVNGINWIADERFLAGISSFNSGAGTPTRYRRHISAAFSGSNIGEIYPIYFYFTDNLEPYEFEVGEFTLESGLDSANIGIKLDANSYSPRGARIGLDEAVLNITAITGNIIEGNFSFTVTENVNGTLTTTYIISDGLFKMEF